MLSDKIKHLGPCKNAVKWLNGQQTADQAWADCQRSDWMLWLLGKLSGPSKSDSHKRLVLCCCEIARLALPYVPNNEPRPLAAIEAAEAWANGQGSLEEVNQAADAAAYAADAAAYAAAYAADAADAAYAAADAAACAAYAADAAAKKQTLAKCADIVRKYYPNPPEIAQP